MGVEWTESMTIARILIAVQNMLQDPEDADHDCVVLNEAAYNLAHYSHDEFDDKVLASFREKREFVRQTLMAPPTCAAMAAKRAAIGNENQTDQVKKLKEKYDNYAEKDHPDAGYNDEAKAARYKEKVWKDHSMDDTDPELLHRKHGMIDDQGRAIM